MCDDDTQLCALPTFKVYIGRLEKKMLTLKRNKQHKKMQELMDELFTQKKKELTVQNRGPLFHGTDRTGPDQIHTLFYGKERTMDDVMFLE